MAHVSYDRAAAVHATTARFDPHRLAWGRLLVLAAALGLWAGVIALARVAL